MKIYATNKITKTYCFYFLKKYLLGDYFSLLALFLDGMSLYLHKQIISTGVASYC